MTVVGRKISYWTLVEVFCQRAGGHLTLQQTRPVFCSRTRIRTILVLSIEYWPILAASASVDIHTILCLYSHAILVSSDGW